MRSSPAFTGRIPAASLLALAFVAAGCYPAAAPVELADGVWLGTDGDRQLAFEFEVSHLGAHAIVHVLQDDREVTEKPARRTFVAVPRIDVRVDDVTHFRGRADLDAMRIRGEIEDGKGARREIVLTRTAPEDVPGLQARPGSDDGLAPRSGASPPTLDDGWPTATPEAVDVDPGRIDDLVAAIVEGEAGVVHSLLLARDGKLVVEEYFHGFTRDDLQAITTCTRSVASLLIGIAIDRGRIEGVSTPVLEFFPRQRSSAAPGWEGVSLEHLLTMTVGRSPEEWRRIGAIEAVETPYPFVLTAEVSGPHGAQWRDGDRDVNLLAGVIRSATGLHADRFAEAHLFAPLGIEAYDWSAGRKDGFPMMHGTLRLRARDLAKLGALVLEYGRWQGKRVVSEAWIREATGARVTTTRPESYGYLWWRGQIPEAHGGDGPLVFASGRGGRYLYVIPSRDAVAVLTTGNEFNGKAFRLGRWLLDRLLPALRAGSSGRARLAVREPEGRYRLAVPVGTSLTQR